MKRNALVLIMLAQAVLAFTGCSHSSPVAPDADLSTRLSGTWKLTAMRINGQLRYSTPQPYDYVIFNKDNSYTQSYAGQVSNGRWTLERDILSMRENPESESIKWKVRTAGHDTMKMVGRFGSYYRDVYGTDTAYVEMDWVGE